MEPTLAFPEEKERAESVLSALKKDVKCGQDFLVCFVKADGSQRKMIARCRKDDKRWNTDWRERLILPVIDVELDEPRWVTLPNVYLIDTGKSRHWW